MTTTKLNNLTSLRTSKSQCHKSVNQRRLRLEPNLLTLVLMKSKTCSTSLLRGMVMTFKRSERTSLQLTASLISSTRRLATLRTSQARNYSTWSRTSWTSAESSSTRMTQVLTRRLARDSRTGRALSEVAHEKRPNSRI